MIRMLDVDSGGRESFTAQDSCSTYGREKNEEFCLGWSFLLLVIYEHKNVLFVLTIYLRSSASAFGGKDKRFI